MGGSPKWMVYNGKFYENRWGYFRKPLYGLACNSCFYETGLLQ